MTTFPVKPRGSRLPFLTKERRRGLEAEYRGLVGRLITSAKATNVAPVVGITACGHGAGVSTIATNLAAAAGRCLEGNTLLVDAHIDQPTIERLFELDEGLGISDILRGERQVQDCCQMTQVPRLAVLEPGADMPTAAFHRPEMWDKLVSHVRRPFQFVLVDLPPIPKLLSQITIAQALDGILLVVHAERTRSKVAQRYREQLTQLEPPVLGVILNRRKTHVPNWLYQRV